MLLLHTDWKDDSFTALVLLTSLPFIVQSC